MKNRETDPGKGVPQKEEDRSGAAGKRPYRRPVLRVFGAVSELTRAGVGSVADAGQTMMNLPSDRRLKRDIVRVGKHRLGIGLYLFRYREHMGLPPGIQVGVMADEVEAILPQAVSTRADGYKIVDYARLGAHPARS